MFMKHKGDYVGFFALNVMEDRLESHIGGILKPYQKFGYFFDMQEYIRRFCLEHELTYFCFGARNENSRVQSIFRKFGYEAYGTDNVFHIPSMISLASNHSPTIRKQMTITSNQVSAIYLQLVTTLINEKPFVFDKHTGNYASHLVHLKDIVPGDYRIDIDHPIQTERQDLVRIKVYDEEVLLGFMNINIS